MQIIIKFLQHLRVIPDIMSSVKLLNDFRLFSERSILLTNLIVISIILASNLFLCTDCDTVYFIYLITLNLYICEYFFKEYRDLVGDWASDVDAFQSCRSKGFGRKGNNFLRIYFTN